MSTCSTICDAGVNIFSAAPGTVVSLGGDASPLYFAVDDSSTNTFHDLKAIATSIGVQGQAGYQFMHALRGFIYVYVFTERVGELVINGLAFPGTCNILGVDEPSDGPCVYGTTGLERVLSWYECNRITSRADPIVINLGATIAYDAFLLGMKADIANPDTGIAQFSMRFNFIPNISAVDDFCFELTDCGDSPC